MAEADDGVGASDGLRRSASIIAILAAFFGLFWVLPPDTSLAQVRRSGVLRACVPDLRPPLVTADPQRPGIEVDLLQAIAQHLGVTLVLERTSRMDLNFNPRDWHVSRAQCSVLAGGIVATRNTRNFLDTTPPYLETGWALLRSGTDKSPKTVSVYPVSGGLDRIALARKLGALHIDAKIVSTPGELVDSIASGKVDGGVTEALTARGLAKNESWQVSWLSTDLGTQQVTFGLWKGDLTLKRAIVDALEQLRQSGRIETLLSTYAISPIGPAVR
jgi:ABC-type amino acid transport substrate-binding protein